MLRLGGSDFGHTRTRVLGHAIAAVTVLSGCADQPTAHSDIRERAASVPLLEAVTDEMAAFVTEASRFELSMPQEQPHPIIPASQASALALSYMRQFGPFNQGLIDRVHGAPVDLATLVPGDRIFFAETPYGPLPDEVPMPHHKAFGPYYVVTLLQEDVPVIVVAVSAYSTDIVVDGENIRYPKVSGNEFRYVVVPANSTINLPIPPEDAVRIAYAMTGARVAALPRLVRPQVGHGVPQYARWEITMERAVEFNVGNSENRVRATSVYISRTGDLELGLPVRGEMPTFDYRDPVNRRSGTFVPSLPNAMVGSFSTATVPSAR